MGENKRKKGWGNKALFLTLVIAGMMTALAARAEPKPLLWETITPRKGASISVYCLQPENPEFGDEVVFYCEFSGCVREEFTYDWQYSDDGECWTSFGSGRPRRCFALSETTAGKYVRVIVAEK